MSFKPVDSPERQTGHPEIVGVAKQVKFRPDESADYVQMYVPLPQDPIDDMQLLVGRRPGAPTR